MARFFLPVKCSTPARTNRDATGGQSPPVAALPIVARIPPVQDQRLTEVETRYSYLERLVEDLSRVIHEQQRLIEALSTRLKRMESLVSEAIEQTDERPAQEKPPHY